VHLNDLQRIESRSGARVDRGTQDTPKVERAAGSAGPCGAFGGAGIHDAYEAGLESDASRVLAGEKSERGLIRPPISELSFPHPDRQAT
jgi:hypothetical protein